MFDRTEFSYEAKIDAFRCAAGQPLARKQLMRTEPTALCDGSVRA